MVFLNDSSSPLISPYDNPSHSQNAFALQPHSFQRENRDTLFFISHHLCRVTTAAAVSIFFWQGPLATRRQQNISVGGSLPSRGRATSILFTQVIGYESRHGFMKKTSRQIQDLHFNGSLVCIYVYLYMNNNNNIAFILMNL